MIIHNTLLNSELHGLRKPDFDSDSDGVGVGIVVAKKIFFGVQSGVRLVQKLGIFILI